MLELITLFGWAYLPSLLLFVLVLFPPFTYSFLPERERMSIKADHAKFDAMNLALYERLFLKEDKPSFDLDDYIYQR